MSDEEDPKKGEDPEDEGEEPEGGDENPDEGQDSPDEDSDEPDDSDEKPDEDNDDSDDDNDEHPKPKGIEDEIIKKLRNSKSGVPKGEYHDYGPLTPNLYNRGTENVPPGAFDDKLVYDPHKGDKGMKDLLELLRKQGNLLFNEDFSYPEGKRPDASNGWESLRRTYGDPAQNIVPYSHFGKKAPKYTPKKFEPLPDDVAKFAEQFLKDIEGRLARGEISKEEADIETKRFLDVIGAVESLGNDIIRRIKEKLGPQYTNLMPFAAGGTRICFRAYLGIGEDDDGEGKEERWRIIKIDKPREDLSSPRAERHVGRGCDTKRDAGFLIEMDHPNLTRFFHYEDIGEGYHLSVERYYDGETLEDAVREKKVDYGDGQTVIEGGTLSDEEFSRIFNGVIEGERYLIKKKKVFHRDLKPSNIIVELYDDDTSENRAIITDFANAIRIKDIKPRRLSREDAARLKSLRERRANGDREAAKELSDLIPDFMPTAGGHLVMDPLLMLEFTGEEEAVYNEQSEMYAIGVNMFYALTGKYIFDFDPDKGIARVSSDLNSKYAGMSLLDKDGLLDRRLYEKVIKDALVTELPFMAQLKYKNVIRRCLTLKEPSRFWRRGRFRSIDELAEQFHEDESTPRRVGMTIVKAALAMLAAYGLMKMGGCGNEAKPNEMPAAHSSVYEYGGKWNKGNFEIENNYASSSLEARVDGDSGKSFPENKRFLTAKTGDNIKISMGMECAPVPEGKQRIQASLEGRIYIEGCGQSTEVRIFPTSSDNTEEFYAPWTLGNLYVSEKINVPGGMKPGVYTIIAEYYTPEGATKGFTMFSNPGKAIERRRIPLVVGDVVPENRVWLSSAKPGSAYDNYDLNLILHTLIDDTVHDINKSLEYEVSLPYEGWKTVVTPQNTANSSSLQCTLPEGESTEEQILQLVIRDKGQVVGCHYLPVKRSGKQGIWEMYLPGRDYQQKTAELRSQVN